MPRRRAPKRQVNWKRLTIAVFGVYIALAALVLVAFEVILPWVGSVTQPAPSGINYGELVTGMDRPLGWWLAAVVVLLAPVTLLAAAVNQLGDRLGDWVRGGRS
jgi:hypothetical protein